MLESDGFTTFRQDSENSDQQLCPYCNKPLAEIRAQIIRCEYRMHKVMFKMALSCTNCKKLLGFTNF